MCKDKKFSNFASLSIGSAAFRQRSAQKELLDAETIPVVDLYKNLDELAFINRYLGGHATVCFGMERLIANGQPTARPLHVVELGCGGGDNLRALARWARRHAYTVQFLGVDLKPEAIDYARSCSIDFPEIEYQTIDYREFQPAKPIDIVFTSLFCHHLADADIVELMYWCQQHSQIGWFFADLHRHPFAYHAIRMLTALFSGSYLVRHDAPLSVKRGFSRADWERLVCSLAASKGIQPVGRLYWRWAFRWLFIVACSKNLIFEQKS